MKDFKDKVAVVTGAASGIGRGIANKCIKEGMKVVLADIKADPLSQVEKKMKEAGANVISVVTDVSKADDVEALAEKTLDSFGEVHLLCNNAGVGVGNLLWEYKLADWKWVFGVNLWGVVHGIHYFIPIMLKQDNECHIVNTSSAAGLIPGSSTQGIYATTKHGVVALSEALYEELKQVKSKIRISVLCPGMVKTNIMYCEQDRPAGFGPPGPNIDTQIEEFCTEYPQFEMQLKMFVRLFENGISPDKVGDIVFQAMRDNAFYILTDTGFAWKKMVKDRMNRILKAFEQNKSYMK
jgi:NADP-dependent 3-hydroxy acid dehydrogenase YdfG